MTWVVRADGVIIQPRLLEIQSDYGYLALGLRPEGFHGWAFKPGKGGAMTLPWSKTLNGEILIGLVHEHRPNFGKKRVWCPLGGFIDLNESAHAAASRESMEEGGIDTSTAIPVPGERINTDRMYYIMEEGDDWGMKVFSIEIPFSLLEPVEQGWRPRAGLITHTKESDLYFLPWRKAIFHSEDALALAGMARLLKELL